MILLIISLIHGFNVQRFQKTCVLRTTSSRVHLHVLTIFFFMQNNIYWIVCILALYTPCERNALQISISQTKCDNDVCIRIPPARTLSFRINNDCPIEIRIHDEKDYFFCMCSLLCAQFRVQNGLKSVSKSLTWEEFDFSARIWKRTEVDRLTNQLI